MSPHRFRRVLYDLGFVVTAGEERVLFDSFDTDGSGTISYRELVEFVTKPPKGSEVGSIAKKLRNRMGEEGCWGEAGQLVAGVTRRGLGKRGFRGRLVVMDSTGW